MIHLPLSLLLVAAAADDVPASIANAQVRTQSAASGLQAVFAPLARQSGPAWIGYEMPMTGRHEMCCYRSTDDIGRRNPGCRVENEGAYTFNSDSGVAWSAGSDFLVLFRVEDGHIERIRTLSRGCPVDFGGKPLHWLTEVAPAQSLALLESLVGSEALLSKKRDKGGMHEPAIAAISLHADPAADALLERLAAPSRPIGVRKQAAFWMGNSRGRRGYETLKRLAGDSDADLREHVVFALSQSEEPEAVDVMIGVARNDADAHVRGQALFWLGQKAGRKATEAITRAVAEDPETAVKKKAVFALSQLPKDEGVPMLIDLARRNTNPAVRKQAMFWLGQSADPRALAFFEEVLAR